ncbi:MAG: MFS transporter [Desulfovibrionaceae bacterium]|nr:MFS transporter [Desulfovibrionaceae bacterium]
MPSRRIFAWGNRYLIAYLAFLSAFAPLSTDMYLPALPGMSEALHTSYELASLSVSSFLLLFAISMLFWGPLSDKYGRKPVLLTGASLYVLASICIALSGNIWALLCWRGVQAVGSGAVSAMSMAVVKDLLRGQTMEKVITWIQTVTILAPMLAPVAGGTLLLVTDWRGIFWGLALCGLLALAGGLALRETRLQATQGSVFRALGRLPVVLRTPGFAKPLLLFSAMSMPLMAYLATSSAIFQTDFGLSAQAYSAFFAFNACASLSGPLLHMALFRHWPRFAVIGGHLAGISLLGAALLMFGHSSPWAFALLFAPVCLCGSAIRPPATVLLMQCVKGDNGTVTSLINSSALLCGSCSMLLCSLPFWTNHIMAIGTITSLIAGGALLAWLRLGRRYESR